MSDEPDWVVRHSLLLDDQLGARRYRSQRRRIEARLEALLRHPLAAAGSERLKYKFSGLRSARVFDQTRLIYRVYQECRRLREQAQLSLDCCLDGSTADRTVNLLCLSEHYADIPLQFDFDR